LLCYNALQSVVQGALEAVLVLSDASY